MDRATLTSDTITPLSSTLHYISSANLFPNESLSTGLSSLYDKRELLGEGSYGKVYRTFLQDSNGNRIEVAVKKVHQRDETEREVEALRKLQGHPNIVKLYKVEDTEKYKLIFLELCQGTLEDAVKQQDLGLPVIEVLRQITTAINHIHRKGFVHKDLKAENILVQRSRDTATYKLADFGLCRKLDQGRQYTMCTSGNKAHKPPEVLLEQERQRMRTESFGYDPEDEEENTVSGTTKVDIFGLGCIFYYVLTKGKHPFEKKGKYDHNILNNKYSLKDIELNFEAHHLIQKMISHVPSERPPASAVLAHPLFHDDIKLRVQKLLLFNLWSDDSALCKTFPASRLLCGVSWLTKFDEADLTRLNLQRNDFESDSDTVRSLAKGFAQGSKATSFEECLQLFQKNVPGCYLDFWMILFRIVDYHYTTVRSELQKAVELNKERAVEDLVEEGDVNFQSIDGKTALHLAVQTSTDKIISLLVDHGARWDVADEVAWTPLHYAARRNLHTVELLFEKYQELTDAHKTGWTPLHIASSLGSDDIVRFLIDQCPALVTARDNKEQTPLHVAANPAVVKELFELRSTEVDALDHQKNTPLHHACGRNLRDVAAVLIKDIKASVNGRNSFSTTPLHIAVQNNDGDCALLLLENGADINAQDQTGASPLFWPVSNNITFLVRELISRNANVNIADDFGQTPLHYAAALNHAEVVSMLVNAHCLVVAGNITGATPLHVAAQTDALESATTLIKNKQLLNSTDSVKQTPLHYAAYFNAEKVAKLLLNRRAKIYAKDVRGGTPLHYAAATNSLKVAKLLIEHGAPLVRDNNGNSALHIAAYSNSVEVASLLIDNFGNVNELTTDKEGLGFTPLHCAASEDAVDVVKLLLDRGSSPDQRSRNGVTPLHITLQRDAVNVASLLLEKGADVNAVHLQTGRTALHFATEFDGKAQKVTKLLLQTPNVNMSIKCCEGFTPLLEATCKNAVNIARLLLEAGADVDQFHEETGRTALHFASGNNLVTVAKLLIEYKAYVNVKCRLGNTPLILAAANNAVDVMQVLIDSKADINAVQSENKSDVNQGRATSLHVAAQRNCKDAVQFLLSNGADVNSKTRNGITPLLEAILSSSVDVVDIILDAYADVTEATEKNIHETTGYTPLHMAADRNDKQVAELLIRKGACVNARSLGGRTALQVAVIQKAKEVVQILLERGAEINAADDTGGTSLYIAAAKDAVDIMELLVGAKVDLSQSNRGGTALHYAAKYNSLNAAKYLLTHGVDPKAADYDGFTALHLAVTSMSLDVFRLLLSTECEVDPIDAIGRTPLHYAVLHRLENYVNLLLVEGADPDVQDKEGVSPRSLAASLNLNEICALFSKSTRKRI